MGLYQVSAGKGFPNTQRVLTYGGGQGPASVEPHWEGHGSEAQKHLEKNVLSYSPAQNFLP